MKSKAIQLTDSTNGVESIDLKIDVKRDPDGLITDGLCVGNTMPQNQALMLIANPGEFMFNPTVGVALVDLLLDEDYLRIRHRIREHFAKDGLVVKSVQLDAQKPLLIEANYE